MTTQDRCKLCYSSFYIPPRFSPQDEYGKTLTKILAASRADNTVYKYKRAWLAWEEWCTQFKVNSALAEPEDISRYLIHLYQSGAPYSRMESAFYAIKWHYDCNPKVHINPCDRKFLHIVLQGLKKLLYKPIVKKEPITPEILKAVVEKYSSSTSLVDIRLCAMILIAYAGFLRYDELINIRRCDLDMYVSHVNIFIMKSKTDIYRQGAWVLIGATNTPTCPVSALRKYLLAAELDDPVDEKFLFRPVNYCKSKESYKLRDGQLSYTRCLDLLREALSAVGLEPKKFGMHSLRSGGATAAAKFGVPDRLFKKHGRWRSETAKDGYIKDSMNDRLSVSLNLGL
ncbi:integrase/recombinase xerD homolog [Diadema antillarum]|uniref:integrase/recombinase xerD homolog n=1 Tax=Diadema antillarum TaxID=105358 RepID=UPI003A8A08C4